LDEHRRHKVLRLRGPWRSSGAVSGRFDERTGLSGHVFCANVRHEAGGAEIGPVERDRISLQPGLYLSGIAILGRISARMAAMAIGLALDESRSLAVSRAGYRRRRSVVNSQNVVAIDLFRLP
jgi:hypothetical protein